jgi:GNAT superfamily N-acetyltransferase
MAAATVAANSRSGAGPLIRALNADDRAALRRLRARSLATDEDSFGRTAAEESAMARIGIEDALDRTTPSTFALGAFDADGAMIGMAAAFQGQAVKLRHCAWVNAVYVESAWRGAGTGRALMLAVLHRLRAAGIGIAKLSVIADPPGARRFYERLGFIAYGVEPEGLRLGERSWDLVLMACDLRR